MSHLPVPVLYVDAGVSFGGSLIVIARLVNALNKKKFNPIVVTAMPLNEISYHFDPDIKVVSLGKRLSYKNRIIFTKIIKNAPFSILKKPLLYFYTIIEYFFNLPYYFRLKKITKIYGVKIVHANNNLEPIKIAQKLNLIQIWHFHGILPYHKSTKIILKKCHHFISISKFVAENAITKGFADRNKLTTIYNPIQPSVVKYSQYELFKLKEKLGLRNKLIIGVFGRLLDWKGQKEYLNAFKLVIDHGIEVDTLFIGDDSEFKGYKKILSDQIKILKLEKNVFFSGFVRETNKYYQLCDLVVHSSIEPEPFGLVITEAMQNKVPVIASSLGAGKELIIEGVTGLLADPRNATELSQKIIQILNKPEHMVLYKENAYKYIMENMEATNYAKKIENIYEELLI